MILSCIHVLRNESCIFLVDQDINQKRNENCINVRSASLQTFSVLFPVDTLINPKESGFISQNFIFINLQESKHLIINAGLYQILNAAVLHMMSQYSFSIKMSVTYSLSIRWIYIMITKSKQNEIPSFTVYMYIHIVQVITCRLKILKSDSFKLLKVTLKPTTCSIMLTMFLKVWHTDRFTIHRKLTGIYSWALLSIVNHFYV